MGKDLAERASFLELLPMFLKRFMKTKRNFREVAEESKFYCRICYCVNF